MTLVKRQLVANKTEAPWIGEGASRRNSGRTGESVEVFGQRRPGVALSVGGVLVGCPTEESARSAKQVTGTGAIIRSLKSSS